ncbi:DNA N-6-adenine-methyltransferase [Microcoleus sp. OTE_8_concoct_300]|uniref:DNA N-6-adenine-methyltransferase n=1 Tax=Microcoleus sp. OTE_8_concoct_300 TaxID=2964710 RepID=UPI00403F31A2
MATTATDVQPSVMLSTGESLRSDSSELNISQDLIESWTEWEKNNFLWLFEFDFCMHKGELKKIEKFLPGTKTIRLEGMQIGSAYLQMWEVEPPRFDVESSHNESNISLTLPPNIGALTKNELISMASEQHQLICVIERKEFELALEKLHRVRLTGVYLQEFKKKCQYGEFEKQLEQAGIGIRSAQCYMTIAKNWEIVEAKAKLVALLTEENQPSIGLKWALETVRDEKKQLKSAAPPKDPDGWRTPNTSDQPIVSLVKKSLGGQIWLDPCSDSGSNIPAAVRYYKQDDGLARHNTWSKTLFINPPFSDPFPWVERCCFEFARGSVSAAVMLLKAGVVSNVGTGELINKYASALCYWRGRINFLNDEGNPIKGSDFDCVLIYFGARLDLFRQAFGGRGTIAAIENHYSSVNKKHLLKTEIAEFGNTQAEQKQLAAAVGLGNGRSVLPDMRDADRALAERYDPHTVVDVFSSPMPPTIPTPPISDNLAQPIAEPEVFDETPLVTRQIQKAKENTLNDYVTAISGNITEFSDEQLKFLLENLNKEVDRRNNQRNDPEFQQRLRQSLFDKLHS